MPGKNTRPRRWQARMSADAAASEQMANAYDRLRCVAARLFRPMSDPAKRARCHRAATLAQIEAARLLSELAERLEATERDAA